MSGTFDAALDHGERRERARARMGDVGLDALLVTGGPNLAYLGGMTGMLGARSGSRPMVYVLPREGEPVLVVHEFLAGAAADADVDAEVRTYSRLSSLPARQLGGALRERGLAEGRIGAEFGPETTLALPVGEFCEFTDGLPGATFVDAQPLLSALRRRKSAAEVERVERACAITAAAYDRTFREIEAGTTGSEVASLVRRHLLDCGGDDPWALVTAGAGRYHRTASGGDDVPVEDGDMVWIDAGCAVEGYWSDYSRAGVVGGPTDRQREAQDAIRRVTADTVAGIEPGRSIAAVARRAEAAIDALDLPVAARLSRQAGRVGHSLGVQVTELPSIDGSADGTFEPGMVLTVEPAFATAFGTFHVEENVVVTGTGTRTLSDADRRLRTI